MKKMEKLPTVRNQFGEAMRVSDRMKAVLVECFLSNKGLVYVSDLLPDREDNGRNTTIYALEDRKLLRHVPRRGGWHNYAHALTPLGRQYAAALVREKIQTLESNLTERMTPNRRHLYLASVKGEYLQ